MKLKHKILFKLRKTYQKVFKPQNAFGLKTDGFDLSNKDANALIKDKLLAENPVMICRFGSSDIEVMISYLNMHKGIRKNFDYITGKINQFWWEQKFFDFFFSQNGIFPVNMDILSRFTARMIDDLKYADIFGSWLKQESFFKNETKNAVKVDATALEPYYFDNPWSEALEGKKVLVIHPFSESIENQYKKRELLFKDSKVLPLFELKTIKAVQSITNNETGFSDWFEALDFMIKQIDETDFDIAIIGCGAYGLPLAAHVKRLGKKAVHIGGPTQVLFGVIGKRWETNNASKFINEHWSRPLKTEVPKNFNAVDDGCYW